MFRYALIIFLLCQVVVGCAQRAPSADAATSSSTLDDLDSRVYQRLATDPVTARMRLSVVSSDGIVTLSGRVESPSERLRAVSVVRGTPGVRAVIDKLRRY